MIQDFVPNSGYKRVCKLNANKHEKDIKIKSRARASLACTPDFER
jgi:hypothetical protein